MRVAVSWSDYELLDSSDGERLERWGSRVLIRPDPQVIWRSPRSHPGWTRCDARYFRSNSGGGYWERYSAIPEKWQVTWQNGVSGSLRCQVGLMNFKHVGLFPEQAVNWELVTSMVKARARPVLVLNLFAYTGCATLVLAAAGAAVCHVDAARGMVAWARENAALSGLADRPVRWIVDDCVGFVEREIRRGVKYDAVVMDPPSYGRGPGREIWKFEDNFFHFVERVGELLSDDPCFVLVNSYTTGLSPSVMSYVLGVVLQGARGGEVACGELGLPVTESGMVLPCGASAVWCPTGTEHVVM